MLSKNKRSDKRFNNRGYSLFFLMGIFLKHLTDSKYTKMTGVQDFYQASSFTDPFQKQPPVVFCKKCALENLRNFIGKHLYWSLFNKVADL